MDKKYVQILKALMDAVIEETKTNTEFSVKIEGILSGGTFEKNHSEKTKISSDAKRGGNRRDPAVLDPISMIEEDEAGLVERLHGLTDKELKDIIADYSMDPSKLAMKWRDRERLINHILEAARRRASKGDAFRDFSDE